MRRAVAGTAAVLLAAACADLSFTPAVDRITTPIATPSFANDIAPILQATCATSGACHLGPTAQLGLVLSADVARANIVNVAPDANVPPAPWLIRPGAPDSSFLFRLLSTTPSVRFGFTRMPLTERPLPDPVVETIRNWILQGAPDN